MECSLLSTSLNAIPNVTVLNVTHYANGVSIPLPYIATNCASYRQIDAPTDLCQVILNVSTSATSTDRVEGWLPDNWNGRFLATGNGGTGGCIDYVNIQHGSSFGFATFGTNIGHDGQFGYEFFLNHPETVNDFGYRAVHAEAVVAKQVVAQHYGRNATYNYYTGCSTGGRQGFQEAIMFPDDFDGILMGSMGVDWLRIVSSKGILARRLGWPDLSSPSYVSAAQWSAIVAAQLELLDPLDGVKDGIIDNPTLRSFDFQILACGTGVLNSSVCLTAAQVDTVRKIYEPLTNEKGDVIFPSFELGITTSVFSANTAVVNGTVIPKLQYPYLQDFWRGAVYNDSTWTPDNFSTTDMDFAVSLNPGGIQIAGDISHDVSAYHARGGKLLAFHGRQDQTVMSAVSSRAFDRTAETLNMTVDEMHDFYRLFYIPGMQHCGGGPGAWSVGQPGVSRPAGAQFNDTQHSVLLALVDWVEKGKAPDTLIGTKFAGDDLGAGRVEAQRKHCVYPNASFWDGVGDTKVAGSWECRLEE